MTVSYPLPRLLGAALLALPLTLAHQGAVLAQNVVFEVENNTSVTLMELYISPSSLDDWEEDVLASEVLYPGEYADINIDDGRDTCVYDIMGVFADNDAVEDYSVNICDLAETGYVFYEE